VRSRLASGATADDATAAAAALRELLPPALQPVISASFIRSHLLYEEFVDRLALRVARETGLEAATRKPASAQEVVAGLGVEARRALFVGDRVKEDIQGPKTLGMRAVLTREWRQEEDPGLADSVIQRLGELPAVISRLTPGARPADTYNEVTSRE